MMSLCRETSDPTGITHCVSAFFVHDREEAENPDIVVAKTAQLEVYSLVDPDGDSRAQNGESGAFRGVLELQASWKVFGEVQGMAALPARVQGFRDALVVAFGQGKVVVLAWDAAGLAIATSSLHLFNPKQLPTNGRTLFPRPEVVRADPAGRCAAVLLLRNLLAVLPAVEAGGPQSAASVHRAAAVGNSFVIELATMGIKCVRDFVFLHKYNESVALILHETDATWAGTLHERKDTCAVVALSISSHRKRQPILWSSRRLPSDAFAVAAVPHGGVLVLSQSLIVFQNKGSRVTLVMNSYALAGEIPILPDFDKTIPAEAATDMAGKYAFNVLPVTAPDAATRGQVPAFQADLASCQALFLGPTFALLALPSGKVALLNLKLDVGRVSSMTVSSAGSTHQPSCSGVCAIHRHCVFLASWTGPSVLINLQPNKPPPESAPADLSAPPSSAPDGADRQAAATSADMAADVPVAPPNKHAGGEAGAAEQSAPAHADVGDQRAGAAGEACASDGLGERAASSEGDSADCRAAGRAPTAGKSSAEPENSTFNSLDDDGDDGDRDAGPNDTEGESPRRELGQTAAFDAALAAETRAGERSASALGKRAAPDAPGDTPPPSEKRSKLEDAAPSQIPAATMTLTAPSAPPEPLSEPAALPAELLYPTSLSIPGLLPAVGQPELPKTGVDEAPPTDAVGDGEAPDDDYDELEKLLYQPVLVSKREQSAAHPSQMDDMEMKVRPVDRLPGFGPITAFAVGEAPESGYEADGKGGMRAVQRGNAHILAAVGTGKSGALVSIRGGVVPWQATSVPLASEVCTGLWAVHYDPDSQTEWPFHAFLVLAFASSTRIFAATSDPALPFKDITDEKQCEYETRARTVFACTMFGGQGIVQVCPTSVTLLAGCDKLNSWDLSSLVPKSAHGRCSQILSATHAGPYLLLHLSGGCSVIMREEESDLVAVDAAQAPLVLAPLASSAAAVCACSLHDDATGWLSHMSFGTESAATGGGDRQFVVVCRANGDLELFGLPHMRLFATFEDVCEGHQTLRMRKSEPSGASSQSSSIQIQITAVRMDSYPPGTGHSTSAGADGNGTSGKVPSQRTPPAVLSARRPLLLVAMLDGRLYLYRAAVSRPPGPPQHAPAAELAFQRLPLDWLKLSAASSQNPPLKLSFIPFRGLANEFGMYQGVFVAGPNPAWLFAHRGGYAMHAMPSEGEVAAMTPWHNVDHQHGFVCVAASANELRFSQLPSYTRMTLPVPVRWRNLAILNKETGAREGVTPHAVTWFPPAKLFFTSLSRRMPLRPHLPASGRDDPHAAFSYRLAEEVAKRNHGEAGFEIRKVEPKDLSSKEVHRLQPLEHVLALETIKLVAPATADQPAVSSWFVAIGIGVLVSEDWASHGSVQLLAVRKERIESGPGEWADIWAVTKAYHREFSGPVTAVAASEGNLILAYGHNVEIHRWNGTKLTRCAIHKDATRLVSSLAIIKNQYVLAGNLRRGIAFLHARDKGGQLALVARDFAETDSVSVEFMLAHTALAFVHADALGNLATFNYQKSAPENKMYEPPGIRLVPLGVFHVGHKINTMRRMQFQLDAGAAKQAGYAVVYGTSSGALGYIAPATAETHAKLHRLQAALYCGIQHVAGLHPKAFRATGLRGLHGLGSTVPYGKPPSTESILDGRLLWEWAMADRRQQARLAEQAGCDGNHLLTLLASHAHATSFY